MSSKVERKLAAVMFTDIAGYTNLMATDEEKSLSLLHSKRDIIKPLIEKYNGIYVKGTGDGTLSYFESAYEASKCAKTFQESIYDNNDLNVRVGIHIGDIVLEEEDVYGDGVNVAARLESMAPPGGICVSNTVYDELRNKKEFDTYRLWHNHYAMAKKGIVGEAMLYNNNNCAISKFWSFSYFTYREIMKFYGKVLTFILRASNFILHH